MIELALMLLGAALLSGVLAGLLGIGGGIVLTPVLFLLFGLLDAAPEWRMHMAIATSLAIIVPTTLAAARAQYRRGGLDGAIARSYAPRVAIGAMAGSVLAGFLPSAFLIALFASLAMLMGTRMLLPERKTALPRGMATGRFAKGAPVGIGLLASMMGIGGATFTVPWLTHQGVPVHRAVGTASLIGAMVALVAVIGYALGGLGRDTGLPYMLGFIYLPAFILMAPVAVLVTPLGAMLAHRLARRTLSALFGLFLLLTAIRLFAGLI